MCRLSRDKFLKMPTVRMPVSPRPLIAAANYSILAFAIAKLDSAWMARACCSSDTTVRYSTLFANRAIFSFSASAATCSNSTSAWLMVIPLYPSHTAALCYALNTTNPEPLGCGRFPKADHLILVYLMTAQLPEISGILRLYHSQMLLFCAVATRPPENIGRLPPLRLLLLLRLLPLLPPENIAVFVARDAGVCGGLSPVISLSTKDAAVSCASVSGQFAKVCFHISAETIGDLDDAAGQILNVLDCESAGAEAVVRVCPCDLVA